MIPPALAAQLAKPLVKWGAIVLLLVVYGIWCYAKGKATVKQEWDSAISKQAQESAAQVIAEAKMSNEVLKDHAKELREAEAAAHVIEREVVKYVQAPDRPCSVDPEFVRLFDALSRMPEPREDSLPTADASAGELVRPTQTDLTTTEVLLAYQRAAEELMWLWLDYDALVQWERGRYIVQQTQAEQPD